jgi:hypothetical protein
MKVPALLAAAGVAAALCAGSALAQTSTFKGLAAASRELSSRIAPKEAPLELERFMPADDMEELLGTWSNYGSEHNFRNGVPNALNMVIWRVTLTRFADALAASCGAPQLALHPQFLATLARLCAWPAPEARSEAVLTAFWLALMGYSAPESEYAAWRDFFLREFAARPAGETIAAMTLGITMNPYFLLAR